MPAFKEILCATEEELVQKFYKFRDDRSLPREEKLNAVAQKFVLRGAQLVCAVGFNPNAAQLTEILPIMGFDSFDDLVKQRNDIFTTDIYKKLTFENIIEIYNSIQNKAELQQIMQYLLKARLHNIEGKIEATVNTLIIEKYKGEMRAIYFDRIATIDFVEERLNKKDSGFRALLNEVAIIIESKLIPTGDIFFRDNIFPEEKRKLLNKGLIPIDLVESRVADKSISAEERKVLLEHLKQNRK
ncbi:MAG: hypothetical protein HN764_13675 [Gammaproteobacteria bacterium]|jgi:hypothetical protein|nr:hypothetical protein [Gammaproteobacteria bacterium]